ncbi:ABC transporter substrate-binding protein [Paenibacillus sp. OAS669]|uniref:ABC transporter substrate-binding protein n=1 Tax=Paenibacillus sp. OAS669 TaxID=2663821 RepID=UPI00178A36A9|nr:extracellular solute-binding protein [Paenibacillus sp. OAS669]MBE1445341.1 ABC-type glycerol-3-phosphate transport system substrate-binding protein [Paenibacillus sp. OAS669]
MPNMKRLPMLGAFLVLAVMASCSSQPKDDPSTTPPSSPTVSKEPAADKSTEKAGLVIYGAAGNTEEEFNNRWGNALRAKFPNYTLHYIVNQKGSTLPELITAGQPIDIIFDSIGGAAGSLIQNGFQYDISELAKKHNVDLSRFEPTFLDATKQLGGLYGLPVNGGGLVLYYNKDIFDKFGVPYPVDGMTWDDLLALSKKVTKNEGGKQYAGFATSVTHPMRMNPMSLDIVEKRRSRLQSIMTNGSSFSKL